MRITTFQVVLYSMFLSFATNLAGCISNKPNIEEVDPSTINDPSYRAKWGDGYMKAWGDESFKPKEFDMEKIKKIDERDAAIERDKQKNVISTPITSTQINSSKPINYSLDDYKQKCSDLGFKNGTEGFGKCVLQLSK